MLAERTERLCDYTGDPIWLVEVEAEGASPAMFGLLAIGQGKYTDVIVGTTIDIPHACLIGKWWPTREEALLIKPNR